METEVTSPPSLPDPKATFGDRVALRLYRMKVGLLCAVTLPVSARCAARSGVLCADFVRHFKQRIIVCRGPHLEALDSLSASAPVGATSPVSGLLDAQDAPARLQQCLDQLSTPPEDEKTYIRAALQHAQLPRHRVSLASLLARLIETFTLMYTFGDALGVNVRSLAEWQRHPLNSFSVLALTFLVVNVFFWGFKVVLGQMYRQYQDIPSKLYKKLVTGVALTILLALLAGFGVSIAYTRYVIGEARVQSMHAQLNDDAPTTSAPIPDPLTPTFFFLLTFGVALLVELHSVLKYERKRTQALHVDPNQILRQQIANATAREQSKAHAVQQFHARLITAQQAATRLPITKRHVKAVRNAIEQAAVDRAERTMKRASMADHRRRLIARIAGYAPHELAALLPQLTKPRSRAYLAALNGKVTTQYTETTSVAPHAPHHNTRTEEWTNAEWDH